MTYDWDFGALRPYAIVFVRGAGVTLLLTLVVIIAGTLAGLPLALLLRCRIRVVRLPTLLLVDLIRSIPPFILILWCYYFVPAVTGMTDLSSFSLGSLALATNLAAFVADIVRGAIDNVPQGVIDAGAALGMSRSQLTRRVIIPEVVNTTLPTISLLFIAALKLSALVSVIACYELTHSAKGVIIATLRAPEVYSVVAAIYVLIIMPMSAIVRRFEVDPRRAEKVADGLD